MKKSAPKEEVARSKGTLQHHSRGPPGGSPNKLLLPTQRNCVQNCKTASCHRALCVASSAEALTYEQCFCTACLAGRTFTGHVLKAAGSWPGVLQLLDISSPHSPVPQRRGMGELSELKEYRPDGRRAGGTGQCPVRRSQRWWWRPHRHREAGRLPQVCGRRDCAEGDTHYVIYRCVIYITCPVSITLGLY